MKRWLLLAGLVSAFAGVCLAQKEEETLLGQARVQGGFGGPFWVASRAVGDAGWGAGGGGGAIIGHFFIGGFGQGEAFGRRTIQNVEHEYSLGFGGLWLGAVYPSHRLIHLFSSLKVGGGGVSLVPRERGSSRGYNDGVFVVVPEAGIELNVVKWFRLVGTVGYRWVGGISGPSAYFKPGDFDSVVWGITLRFGSFGRAN